MATGIGNRIKIRRKELGLSQQELAERMGLKSKSTICKIERGEDNLTSPIIMRYAQALETTPEALAGWGSNNDAFESFLIREMYKHFTPEELDDPKFSKQIANFMDFLKRLDPQSREHLLDFAQNLKLHS